MYLLLKEFFGPCNFRGGLLSRHFCQLLSLFVKEYFDWVDLYFKPLDWSRVIFIYAGSPLLIFLSSFSAFVLINHPLPSVVLTNLQIPSNFFIVVLFIIEPSAIEPSVIKPSVVLTNLQLPSVVFIIDPSVLFVIEPSSFLFIVLFIIGPSIFFLIVPKTFFFVFFKPPKWLFFLEATFSISLKIGCYFEGMTLDCAESYLKVSSFRFRLYLSAPIEADNWNDYRLKVLPLLSDKWVNYSSCKIVLTERISVAYL